MGDHTIGGGGGGAIDTATPHHIWVLDAIGWQSLMPQRVCDEEQLIHDLLKMPVGLLHVLLELAWFRHAGLQHSYTETMLDLAKSGHCSAGGLDPAQVVVQEPFPLIRPTRAMTSPDPVCTPSALCRTIIATEFSSILQSEQGMRKPKSHSQQLSFVQVTGYQALHGLHAGSLGGNKN